jgi:hypothetical protein
MFRVSYTDSRENVALAASAPGAPRVSVRRDAASGNASVREAGDGAEYDANASVREAGDGAEYDANASPRRAERIADAISGGKKSEKSAPTGGAPRPVNGLVAGFE